MANKIISSTGTWATNYLFYISRTAGRLINEFFLVFLKYAITLFGNFLVNDFWTAPPPPINFVHGSYMLDMDIFDQVAATLGPLACPSPSARPGKCLNIT